jgi:hypothetical protein
MTMVFDKIVKNKQTQRTLQKKRESRQKKKKIPKKTVHV